MRLHKARSLEEISFDKTAKGYILPFGANFFDSKLIDGARTARPQRCASNEKAIRPTFIF